MLNVVIDTNVIISSALTPDGKPDKVINAVIDRQDICWIYSLDIFDEYADVLSRPKHKFSPEKQGFYLNTLKRLGDLISVSPSAVPLPDEDDRKFYDAAKASGALLITGNRRHYPDEDYILTPDDFAEKYID
jgi:putative PIN family toxin of toxin-antitoxin system